MRGRSAAEPVTSVEDFDDARLAELGRFLLTAEATRPTFLQQFAAGLVSAFLAQEVRPDSKPASRALRRS